MTADDSPTEIERFTTDDQDPEMVGTVYQKVSQLLTSDEAIRYIAVQKKPVVNIAPDCVILTTRRFIVYRPKLLGRVSFEDHIWRQLRDAQLTEEVLGATLSMQTTDGGELSVSHLPKAQARRLYAIAQEMEELAVEERRRRHIEETRAAAGGVVVQQGGTAAASESTDVADDPVAKLKTLKQMLDAELISQDEYDQKKAEILSRM